MTTGIGAVHNTAKVEPGSSVAVIDASRIRPQLFLYRQHDRSPSAASCPSSWFIGLRIVCVYAQPIILLGSNKVTIPDARSFSTPSIQSLRSDLIKDSCCSIVRNGKHIKSFSFDTCRFHPRRSHRHSRSCKTSDIWTFVQHFVD